MDGINLSSSSYFPATVLDAGEFATNQAVLSFPGNISDPDECFEDDKEVGFRKGLGVFN